MQIGPTVWEEIGDDGQTYVRTDRRTYGRTDVRTDGRTDGHHWSPIHTHTQDPGADGNLYLPCSLRSQGITY